MTRDSGKSIAVTAELFDQMWTFWPFCLEEVQPEEPAHLSDDQVVAAILGWRLRRLGDRETDSLKDVINELEFRARPAAMLFKPYDDVRDIARSVSTRSSVGHMLTIDGIDNQTSSRLVLRAKRVSAALKNLDALNDLESVQRFHAGCSDELVFDLSLHFRLTHMGDVVSKTGPIWAFDELARRAKAREDAQRQAAAETDRRQKEAWIAHEKNFVRRELGGFERQRNRLFRDMGLSRPSIATQPAPMSVSSPALDRAMAAYENDVRIPNDCFTNSLVVLESHRPDSYSRTERKFVEGIIALLVGRMLQHKAAHILVIAPETNLGGPYVRVSRPKPGFLEVSIASNYAFLEKNENVIGVLLGVFGWTRQVPQSLETPVYTKAWQDSTPLESVALEVAATLESVLGISRRLPAWFLTTLLDDALIGALPHDVPVTTFSANETLVGDRVTGAQMNRAIRASILHDATRLRPTLTQAASLANAAGAAPRSLINDNYLDNLIWKLEQRFFYAVGFEKSLSQLLAMHPIS